MAVVKGHGQHIAYKHTPCAHIAVVVRHRHARQAASLPPSNRERAKKQKRLWINSLPIYGPKEVLWSHSSKQHRVLSFFFFFFRSTAVRRVTAVLCKNKYKLDWQRNKESRYGKLTINRRLAKTLRYAKWVNCIQWMWPCPLFTHLPSFWLFLLLFFSCFIQMGAHIKEFLRLVEDFVSMIGMQMSGFQDIYEVTENLGEP